MATTAVTNRKVVSHAEWLTARKAFLKKEEEFTRLRDELSAAPRTSLGKSREESNMRQALEARRSDAMSRYRPLRSKRAVAAQRSPLVGAQRLGVLAAVTGGAKFWPARE